MSSKRKLAREDAYHAYHLAQIEKSDAMGAELATESDRGAAVLGAAYLDDLLEQYLRERLDVSDLALNRAERDRIASLWGPSGPLGAFATRITMCLLLEIMPLNYFRCLSLIREIRNGFAHNMSVRRFSDPSITALVERLWVEATRRRNVPKPGSPRQMFIRAVTDLAVHINITVRHPDGWKEIAEERSKEPPPPNKPLKLTVGRRRPPAA